MLPSLSLPRIISETLKSFTRTSTRGMRESRVSSTSLCPTMPFSVSANIVLAKLFSLSGNKLINLLIASDVSDACIVAITK